MRRPRAWLALVLTMLGCAPMAEEHEHATSAIRGASSEPAAPWREHTTRPALDDLQSAIVVLHGPSAIGSSEGAPDEAARNVAIRKYAELLAADHVDLRARIEAAGGIVVADLVLVANAFQVRATSDALERIARLPGVSRLERPSRVRRGLAEAVPLVGAHAAWSAATPFHGAGMRIGIIDSGVDYLHADLGGAGDPAAFTTNDPTSIEPGSFPTAKVVGGRDLVGDDYDAAGKVGDPSPVADADPIDCGGHGTHVAGIAAGAGVTLAGTAYAGPYDASIDPSAFLVAPGVAPEASLFALRIFGCDARAESEMILPALEIAADPDGDLDPSDRLDVVNASFSVDYGAGPAAELEAITALTGVGTLLVAANGNAGSYYRARFTAGHPATAPEALAVGASLKTGSVTSWLALNVTSPPEVAGIYPLGRAVSGPQIEDLGAITADVIAAEPIDGCEDFGNADAVDGAIAIVRRGNCSFVDKLDRAAAAGAVALLIVDNLAEDLPLYDFAQGGSSDIPGFGMRQLHGDLLLQNLPASVTITAGVETQVSLGPDYVVDFSSRGPGAMDRAVKPEITAPGVELVSAAIGTGSGSAQLSGTSMAAPLVSGAAALLREANPAAGPLEIKRRLMSAAAPVSGVDGNSFPVSLRGAGRLALDRALSAPISARASGNPAAVGVSFGAIVRAAPGEDTRDIVIDNHGSTAISLVPSVSFDLPSSGVEAAVSPARLDLGPGESASVTLTLSITPAELPQQPLSDGFTPFAATYNDASGDPADMPRHLVHEIGGDVALTIAGNDVPSATVPWLATVRGASDRSVDGATGCALDDNQASEVELSIVGALGPGETATSVVQLGTESSTFSDPGGPQAAFDIVAIGAASNVATAGRLDRVFFGAAMAGPWTTPARGYRSVVGFEVDRDDDDVADYFIGVEGLLHDGFQYFQVTPNDIALVRVTELASGDSITRNLVANGAYPPAPGGAFYDGTPTHDTQLYDNDVILLPVLLEDLGIDDPADASFRYRGVSGYSRLAVLTELSVAAPIDETEWVAFDAAQPGTDTARGFDASPLFVDDAPITTSARGDQRLLVLHHTNAPGSRFEIVDLASAGIEGGDLSIAARDAPESAAASEPVAFELVVDNAGSHPRSDVTVTVTGSSGAAVALASTVGQCDGATCSLGDLEADTQAVVTVTWQFAEAGPQTLAASVTSAVDCETEAGDESVTLAVELTTPGDGDEEDDGCGCRVVERRSESGRMWWMTGPLLVVLARRRLASRALARALLIVPLGLLAIACGDDASDGGGGAGGASATGGAGGAAPVPILDPSLFDCSRTSDPERINAIPVECATDPACTTRLVSGHRGAGGLAPEDTVTGVHAAIALGVDYVETDPRPTKDGFLVNLHDTSVDRTTDGTGEASDLTLAEIQALAIETFELPGDFSCERVPTLEEILIAARGKVHVLVDANKTDRVDLLVGAIQSTDTVDWAIFDTSSVDKIDEALLLEPDLLTMIRVDTQADLDSQLEHFADHPPIIVELTGGPIALNDAVHGQGNRAFRDVFVSDVAAGFADDPSLYGEVFDLGLDIAQTDRPDLVLRYLGRFPE